MRKLKLGPACCFYLHLFSVGHLSRFPLPSWFCWFVVAATTSLSLVDARFDLFSFGLYEAPPYHLLRHVFDTFEAESACLFWGLIGSMGYRHRLFGFASCECLDASSSAKRLSRVPVVRHHTADLQKKDLCCLHPTASIIPVRKEGRTSCMR